MLKLIRLSSVSKDFFDLLDQSKHKKKIVSITKLVVVSAICFLVVGFYARWVNQASTRGYFLKQEQKGYDSLVFQRSISQLDILQLERILYDDVLASSNSRYTDEDRRVVLAIGKPAGLPPTTLLEPTDVITDIGHADMTSSSTILEY